MLISQISKYETTRRWPESRVCPRKRASHLSALPYRCKLLQERLRLEPILLSGLCRPGDHALVELSQPIEHHVACVSPHSLRAKRLGSTSRLAKRLGSTHLCQLILELGGRASTVLVRSERPAVVAASTTLQEASRASSSGSGMLAMSSATAFLSVL